MNYNPHDHYWFVAGSTTQVYSSRRAIYVPVADAEYAAWVATGESVATKIDSENSLRNVLAKHGIGFQAEKPAVSFDAGPIDKALFEGLFWCVNEIRALKGQGALTRAQALAFLRNFL